MNPEKIVGASWAPIIGNEFSKPYMKELSRTVRFHRERYQVFPFSNEVFRAFYETPYEKVKVVILGQDPYPTPGNADGLAFSFRNGTVPENYHPNPRSLSTIFDTIERDLGVFHLLHSSDLSRWARQGVLLLNTALTVVENLPGSHTGIGWEQFTRNVIMTLNLKPNQIVYLLWGKHAQSFIPFIRGHHEYLTTSHPAARGEHNTFKNCRHFSHCNEILKTSNQTPINWITHE